MTRPGVRVPVSETVRQSSGALSEVAVGSEAYSLNDWANEKGCKNNDNNESA